MNNKLYQNTFTNALKNNSITKSIFLDIKNNPERVTLNTDAPGVAVLAKITFVSVNTTVSPPPSYFQLDFGGMIHKEVDQTFGARPTCIQIPVNDTASLRTKIPIKFHNNKVPQFMNVTVYGPGEPGEILPLGSGGIQVWIEYQFIAY